MTESEGISNKVNKTKKKLNFISFLFLGDFSTVYLTNYLEKRIYLIEKLMAT